MKKEEKDRRNDEIADMLNTFGTTQTNATSNASLGTSTDDGSATAICDSNNAIVPQTSRRGNETVATNTICADTAAVGTPVQEER